MLNCVAMEIKTKVQAGSHDESELYSYYLAVYSSRVDIFTAVADVCTDDDDLLLYITALLPFFSCLVRRP